MKDWLYNAATYEVSVSVVAVIVFLVLAWIVLILIGVDMVHDIREDREHRNDDPRAGATGVGTTTPSS